MSKLTDPYTPCGSIPFTLCKLKLKEIFGSWGEVRVFNPPVVMPGCSLKSWRDLKSSCYLGPNPRNFDLIIQVERKILKTIVYFNSTVYLLSVLSLLSSCPSHKTCQSLIAKDQHQHPQTVNVQGTYQGTKGSLRRAGCPGFGKLEEVTEWSSQGRDLRLAGPGLLRTRVWAVSAGPLCLWSYSGTRRSKQAVAKGAHA